jgi:hypothetical protein
VKKLLTWQKELKKKLLSLVTAKSPQNKTQIFAEKAKSRCVLFCSPSIAQKLSYNPFFIPSQ